MSIHKLICVMRTEGAAANIEMQYKDREPALAAFNTVNDREAGVVEISDDYGAIVSIHRGDCLFVLLQDYEKAIEASAENQKLQTDSTIEVQMFQARANKRAQQRASKDPLLNGSMDGLATPGFSMVPPGPGGGGRN